MPAKTQKFGAWKIETPALFASYRIGDRQQAGLRRYPWKMTDTQGILLNAFDLLANRRTQKFSAPIRDKKTQLHESVKFKGPLILDSGAYNFQQHTEISINPIDVLSIGIELGADVSVVLDHPFLPTTNRRERKKRWSNTKKNTHSMFEELESRNGEVPDNFQLMPVLHGHSKQTLERSLRDIVEIWGQPPDIVGIGSLAPLARNGNKRKAIRILVTVRKLLPHAHIHCFSLGSALLMLFAFYCGADTVDSQTWMMSAAFKQVQLPGFPWTRFSPREAEKDPAKYEITRHKFAQHLLKLTEKEGFKIRNWDNDEPWEIHSEQDALPYLTYLEDCDGVNNIHRRACHNLYALNFEARRVRKEKENGNLEDFIHNRMASTIYRKVSEYAFEQVASKL